MGRLQDPITTQCCLALVHHANQYVIADDYGDREGVNDILGLGRDGIQKGLLPLLQMHLRYQVPLNLHLSGTFIEALAWHCPQSFSFITRLREAGLLELVGSTFAQNIMPFFSDAYNLRQMNEELWLYRRQLGWDLDEVKTFWVPERVWNTKKMAHLLQSRHLLNGGYRFVLLDDRLLFPVGESYPGSAREKFDREEPLLAETFHAWEIAGGNGLVMLPICKRLRYLIPPDGDGDCRGLPEIFEWLASAQDQQSLAVYGDDLEKVAGVGGWDRLHLQRYEKFLGWLKDNSWIHPVLIGGWAAKHSPAGEREIEHGTFYELAQMWSAGEDYRGWYEDPRCSEHRQYLVRAERSLAESEERGADRGLLELGWKHLLHCSYETSWHDPCNYDLAVREGDQDPRRLAGWAAALASHARSCAVVTSAAEWFVHRDGRAHADLADIDGDGELELVLKNDHLFAVLSPNRGGRLTCLLDLTGRRGRLVVGNISDDWNLQEELNRYMDQPRNHPGAFADVGHEHDRYEPVLFNHEGRIVQALLCNVEPQSALCGAKKQFSLEARDRFICVDYILPGGIWRVSTEVCFSPDYYRLLRHGRAGVVAIRGRNWKGWRNRSACSWLRIDPGQSTIWDRPYQKECGHGFNSRITSFSREFHLELGVGTPPLESCHRRKAETRAEANRSFAKEPELVSHGSFRY